MSAGCFGHRWQGEDLYASELKLRQLRPEDAAALAELGGDAEVSRTTAHLPHPFDAAQATAFIGGLEASDETVLAIERLADRRLIGCIGFRPACGGPDIGYWLGRAFWGKGYATQALKRLLRLLFEDLEATKVTAQVMRINPASARVLEKAGFHRATEGTGCEGRCSGVATTTHVLEATEWRRTAAALPILLVTAVAMVDIDGRVLLARRPEGKAMAGLWEFPGGKLHEGETPEAALVRELREELAVDITESCLAPLAFASHSYDDRGFHLLMPLYLCRTWKGTVTPLEGQELRWVRPVRMTDLPMPPADLPLVPLLRDFLG